MAQLDSSSTLAPSSSAFSNFANTGILDSVLSTSLSSPWIIDFGATDHITCDSQHVLSMKQSIAHIVSTTNGNLSPVIGECSISLSHDLNLDSILVVPSLNHNLLSVAQITCALYYVVIFWPNFCVFKDIRTRKTIGCGTRRGNLYYLDLNATSSHQLAQVLSAD